MKLLFNKVTLVSVATLTGLVVGGVTISKGEAAMDWLGLEQKIQQQDEQLGNHEARITNTEEDVSKLQENTNTPPSDNKVPVPVVSPAPTESAPAPEQTQAPITVTSVSQLPANAEGKTMCVWTFSDRTTSNFYAEDELNRSCDASAIGKPKP